MALFESITPEESEIRDWQNLTEGIKEVHATLEDAKKRLEIMKAGLKGLKAKYNK